MTSLLAVQTGIYEVLSGDSALLAIATGGVHDDVPQGTAYPYVVIGEKTEIPDNMYGDTGHEATVTLHIWDNAKGDKRGLQILERMDELLDNQPLSVNGYDAWWVENEFVTTLREGEGSTLLRHIVPRYRVKLQET